MDEAQHQVEMMGKIYDIAHLYEINNIAQLYGVQPSQNADEAFKVDWQDPTSGIGITEQLYTARGSQGIGTSVDVIKTRRVDISDYKSQNGLTIIFFCKK